MSLLVSTYSPDSFEFSSQVVDLVLRRTGSLRLVWSADFVHEPAVITFARWLGARGVVPRAVHHVPVRALIMDRTVGVLFDGEQSELVRTSALQSLCQFVDRMWERGRPVPSATAAEAATSPPARSELILRLLAEGLTDEAVARRIGVSVRTVRNDVASSMSCLDARSRFQAGVRAAQLGLI
ncbi:LuxR C-terminal-related transcriptional regulator [Lentzea sp. NBRC 105346]|uniref:helix-turn-helix transcriptional regulator n=1 Tax=Lentzea sp. NBRC 105346 TaxID=3032205 RepID=UPI0025571F44|nr:LuxR C-terminal-related transcriptional regulator [Lentzea sp. NBRC 105346]